MVLHLTVSLNGGGHHPAAWRVSNAPLPPNAKFIQAMARIAERGKLDAILLGLHAGPLPLDPLPLLGSVIAVTRDIGLAAAWSVDHTEPYHVARVFATLDYLSYGRTAWIVRALEPDLLMPLMGRPSLVADPASWCRRAAELIDAAGQLWDSWEDAAFAVDKPSGMFVDPERVHPIHHAGEFFTVRGPLNVPRPPQGHPVLILSDPDTTIGKQFVAANAEVILVDNASLPEALASYAAYRASAAEHGRKPLIFSNLRIVLGETEAAARKRASDLDIMSPAGPGPVRFVGTPEQLVEFFASWREQRACDGFNLLPAVLPFDLELLVDAAIPLARGGGLVRAEYGGSTLRDHFGLSRPRNRFAAP
jgi:alkanesulfonate monooxygenase SsuD/methylene tetrahydromethanopterin reductase-like flavin-dependent oxidoreductase (luciferase family)